jgi:N-acetylglutamate synthase-like GNAT family acetyltransferase
MTTAIPKSPFGHEPNFATASRIRGQAKFCYNRTPMRVRKAGEEDFLQIIELARSLDLDTPGMEGDRFWVAEEEDGRIVGVVALKKHPDCLELCALGVEAAHRGRGIAKALVEALMAEARGDVHLATIIPGFFEAVGFERTTDVPRTFIDRKRAEWCEGCDRRLCTVMLRKVS